MQLEVELLHSFLAFTVYVILKQLTMFCFVFLDSVYLFDKDGLFENIPASGRHGQFKIKQIIIVFFGHLVVKKMIYMYILKCQRFLEMSNHGFSL